MTVVFSDTPGIIDYGIRCSAMMYAVKCSEDADVFLVVTDPEQPNPRKKCWKYQK